MPLLSAAKLDGLFRVYLLAALVDMQLAEGKAVVLPNSAEVERIDPSEYRRM